MYTFEKPVQAIARDIRNAARKVSTEQPEIKWYQTIYNGTPTGRLTITVCYDNTVGMPYYEVKAELYRDMGRANEVYDSDFSTAAIAYALGVTCASALWRADIYA